MALSAGLTIETGAQDNKVTRLDQNFPNPFTQVTVIKYYIPMTGQVKLTVQNMLGAELTELENGRKEEGEYSVRFEGSNYPSGQYSYTLTFRADADGSQTKLTKKMYLVR